MHAEIPQVEKCLRQAFSSANDIFIDPLSKECETKISVDEYEGEFDHYIIRNKVRLKLIDYNDTYPFKYVFSYTTINQVEQDKQG